MEQSITGKELTLEIQHLKKSFRHGKKNVLQDICLEAQNGECIGILGANGCGKSTLLSILAGIQPASSGTVLLNGTDLFKKNKKEYISLIGYVPQECPMMEELNAYYNLKLL